jgi:centrosomal protein CEP164
MSRFSSSTKISKGKGGGQTVDDLLFDDEAETGSHAPTTESVVLEEELPEDYEPTEEEILEYAKWLGMDIEQERDLFWIAREGLKAPLPENWKPCKTKEEEIYYFNFATGESVWDHPCDEYYRKVSVYFFVSCEKVRFTNTWPSLMGHLQSWSNPPE